MLRLLLATSLLLLGACAAALPDADPQRAWVSLHNQPGDVLLAYRQDGVPVSAGRYFQLAPGAHELQVRVQFELPGGAAGGLHEPATRSCIFTLHYAEFSAGQTYRLVAGQQSHRGWVRLYDPQQKVLARGQELRCAGV